MRSLEIGLQATMPNNQHERVTAESVQDEVQELSWEEFLRIQPTVDSLLLDVRRESDARTFEGWNQMAIPAAELSANLSDLEGYSSIYCFCTSGNSSRKAVALLNKAMSGKTIVSIQGGMRVFANLVTGKEEDERAKT
jgi:rhodanese-related sulfurtransferase